VRVSKPQRELASRFRLDDAAAAGSFRRKRLAKDAGPGANGLDTAAGGLLDQSGG